MWQVYWTEISLIGTLLVLPSFLSLSLSFGFLIGLGFTGSLKTTSTLWGRVKPVSPRVFRGGIRISQPVLQTRRERTGATCPGGSPSWCPSSLS